jgi:hypothetical protein
LVVGEHLEVLHERTVEDARLLTKVAATTADEEQPGPCAVDLRAMDFRAMDFRAMDFRAMDFIVDVDIANARLHAFPAFFGL